MKNNLFLSIITILVSLFFTEIILDSVLGDKNKKNLVYDRYMLYSEGDVFKNIGKILKYHPNKNIISKTFYDIDGQFKEEYSYIIETNNFGLVQKNDIEKNKESILFLGDSFTEGQGAKAWINNFQGFYKNLQLINGGILGAGFNQFELLEKHISKTYNIKKVVVLYIGDDLRRGLFNHNNQVVSCLKNHLSCNGYENFYGFNQSTLNNHLNFLKSKRVNEKKKSQKTFTFYKRSLKKYLTQLSVFYYPHKYLRNKFYNSKNVKVVNNFNSIDNLIEKYKSNIFFIRLKQKEEILKGDSYYTIQAKKHIERKSSLYECDFNDDINNFYKYDGHPNQSGYEYLFKCVENILNKNY